VVPADPSEDLLHIELNYDQVNDAYTLSATRIVEGFYLPVDAELVGNALYVIENWGSTQRSMWKVTMPIFSGLEESPAPSVARLSAWPVPASDAVHWSCAGLTPRSLELLDPAGRLVRSERPAASSGTIDLGGIPGGAYVLRAHSATTTSSSRIIIAR
jgi:hypothetical protein